MKQQSKQGTTTNKYNQMEPTTQEGDDDDYYEEEDDGMTPGPGAYFNTRITTTFKVTKVPERLQFFGSTVERFNRNTKTLETAPGPGAYTVELAARAQTA